MKIDTKELFLNIKMMAIPLIILIALVLIPITLSRYIGTSSATGTGITAIPILEYNAEGTNPISLPLADIKPGDSNTYNFVVKNSDTDGNVTEVNLEYILKIYTTNNLPLKFTINCSNSTPNTTNKTFSANGVLDYISVEGSFNHSTSSSHSYSLLVEWDGNYSASYQNMIDLVVIEIDWGQEA